MEQNIKIVKTKAVKPFYKRVWFIITITILLIIGITALTMPFTYGVQNILLKAACSPKNKTKLSDYDTICEKTTVKRDIAYPSSFSNAFLDIITPAQNTEILPLVVYFHGGYYVAGGKTGKEAYCRMISSEGYIVANVDYVLAPEGKYPSQLIQANEAIKYLVDNAESYGFDKDKIFIGGDSAGCHLSGQLGTLYTNMDFQSKINTQPALEPSQIKGLILLCGFYDMSTVRQTRFPFVNDAMWMLTGVKKYENFHRVDEMSIIKNVNENYPSAYLLCGSDDPFYKQNLEMKEVLEKNNVDICPYLPISNKKKLIHEFQDHFNSEEAYIAREKLIEFLKNRS